MSMLPDYRIHRIVNALKEMNDLEESTHHVQDHISTDRRFGSF
jgi:hypothetical protein